MREGSVEKSAGEEAGDSMSEVNSVSGKYAFSEKDVCGLEPESCMSRSRSRLILDERLAVLIEG